MKEEDATKSEDTKEEESGNEPEVKPAGDTDNTTDVKETVEETAVAETKEEEPAPTLSEPSGSTEAAAAVESPAPAVEVAAEPEEPKQAEVLETPMMVEQGLTESTAVSAASE